MAGKIFFHERGKVKEGSKTPRFRVLAVSGIDLQIYGNHFRKKELQKIAKATNSKLVALERDPKAKTK